MIHVPVYFMLFISCLPWLCAATPVLIRKHPQNTGSLQGSWETHDRAPTGHKYSHLYGFQAAFEEMNAIRKAADDKELKNTTDPVKQELEEECMAAGDSCKKSIQLVKDKEPQDKQAKMEYLCTPESLSCLGANLGKCQHFHDEVMEIQKQWECEAMRCSAAGPNCSSAVTFLEMDDSKLSDETRHKKTRFLCSNDANKCLTDHKDICKTAFDIVSTANDMGHCDKIHCSDAGHDCRTAVTFLTQDPVSNITVKESKEKWSYLCGDAPFKCLESHLDQCTRYYNSLKLAFAEGHCNSARCAAEGPDCARAVGYLSNPEKFYYGEELRNKTEFLCGDRGIACIMEHGTCAEFQEDAKKQYQSSVCSRSTVAQVELPTLPPNGQVDARLDAERAFAKLKIKEKEEQEKKTLVKAKAAKAEATKVKSGDSGTSEGEGSDSKSDAKGDGKTMTKEEKEKAGKKIFAGLVAGAVAIIGFIFWRRRRSKSGGTAAGATSPPSSPKTPKTKTPPKPKLEMFQKKIQQAASAMSSSGSALSARLRAFMGFGAFKKEEAQDEAAKEGEESKATASTEEVKAEETPKPEVPAAEAAPKAAPKAPEAETGAEEPREY